MLSFSLPPGGLSRCASMHMGDFWLVCRVQSLGGISGTDFVQVTHIFVALTFSFVNFLLSIIMV